MKESIGIIGQGFVGSAVREGMKNHFNIYTYDKDKTKQTNTSSVDQLVSLTRDIFLCVPTPMKKNGECDLSIVRSVLRELDFAAYNLGIADLVVILKSTVPPGTTKGLNREYSNLTVTFNPEFLTEANAVEDYKNQSRIIIGGEREVSSRVKHIFSKVFPKVNIIKTDSTTAEMIKYVTNTFLATKVSFANEMYELCRALSIDYDKVIEYARYDDRLGHSHWAVPGPDGDYGYGGHCFPKDIKALEFLAKSLDVDTTILTAAINKNALVRTDLDWLKQVGRAVSED